MTNYTKYVKIKIILIGFYFLFWYEVFKFSKSIRIFGK